jgi:membrane protein
MARMSDPLRPLLLLAGAMLLGLAIREYREEQRSAHQLSARKSCSETVALQPDRGRTSSHPLQIPRRGWKDILWRTYTRFNQDRLLATAAGVVFFGLLAVFPAVTALVSCYGLFADPKTVGDHLQMLAVMLPEGSFQIVEDQVNRVLAKGNTELGFTFAFGLAFAVWSANAGVKAIIDALNVVYEEREKRSFVGLNLISLAFTLGGLLGCLMMVAAVVALPLVLAYLGRADSQPMLMNFLRWPTLLLLLVMALGLLYRFGPSRRPARWEWLGIGTLVAAFLWLLGSALLSWYLSHFADYNATYGSLGAAIGLMTWMWMSAIVVLLGAELNSEIEHQTAIDTTVGAERPMGHRQARMADTLGPARD